ncbi:hypothetical protein EMIHUDRAFT_124809, partial [Emiliania huxleyi CCMP1516]|uniref:UDP-galactopyranose mutase C-terminal domain-containing protein n=2 Tax=Emiliania huxleyi TaxID=2903 RepID=A0A0D3IFY1_EMIH1
FKHYTKKQWGKYPAELDASVLMWLPCRTTTDDRYFGDQWQALPLRGYTRIFENMLLHDPNITLRVGVDYFKERAAGTLPEYGMLVDTGMLVYTGPIDAYFGGQVISLADDPVFRVRKVAALKLGGLTAAVGAELAQARLLS